MVLRYPTRAYQPDRASRNSNRTATHPADHTPHTPTAKSEKSSTPLDKRLSISVLAGCACRRCGRTECASPGRGSMRRLWPRCRRRTRRGQSGPSRASRECRPDFGGAVRPRSSVRRACGRTRARGDDRPGASELASGRFRRTGCVFRQSSVVSYPLCLNAVFSECSFVCRGRRGAAAPRHVDCPTGIGGSGEPPIHLGHLDASRAADTTGDFQPAVSDSRRIVSTWT